MELARAGQPRPGESATKEENGIAAFKLAFEESLTSGQKRIVSDFNSFAPSPRKSYENEQLPGQDTDCQGTSV